MGQHIGTSEQSSFAADTLLNAAASVCLAGLGMLGGILAARLLGPGGRGRLAAIQTWPTFIAGLAALGMPEALVYFSARHPSEAGRYLGSGLVVGLLSSVPFVAAGYALMPLMLHAQSPTIVWAGRWYLLVVPIFILMGLPRHPLQGRSDFVSWNAMRIAPNVLWIGVLVLAWACVRTIPTFVAAANLAALALLIIPFALFAKRRIPGPFRPDPRKLPSMLIYGIPCMMTMVPQTLNVRLDQMLMAALLPAHELGLYVVAVAWSGAVLPLMTALGFVTMPAVASANDPDQGVRRFASATRVAATLALILAIMLAVATPLGIIILFGSAFKASIPAALVLVPAAAVLGLNYVLQEGLRGLGHPYAVLQAELAGLAVTIVTLAALLIPMGIIGAAVSSLLGYMTVTSVLLLKAQRHTGASLAELLFISSDEIQHGVRMLSAVLRRAAPIAG